MTKKTVMILENLLVALMLVLLAISLTGYLGWHKVTVPIVEVMFVALIAGLGIKQLKKKVGEDSHV